MYDAFGHDLVRDRKALEAVRRYSPAYFSECPAPVHMEIAQWSELSIDDISQRVGWADDAAGSAIGTLNRIEVMLDMTSLRTFLVGDTEFHTEGDSAGRELLSDEQLGPSVEYTFVSEVANGDFACLAITSCESTFRYVRRSTTD